MGKIVLCLGKSGTGKSASLRNFDINEVGIFNVANKDLPFRKKLNKMDLAGNVDRYAAIKAGLTQSTKKVFVIDDSQYLLAFEFFDRAKETGYGKFTDLAMSFRNLLQFIIAEIPSDVIVYFLHHSEQDEYGTKAKTIGKMLDEKLTLEGMFSIVLRTNVADGKYTFMTQNDGSDTVKTPMGLFDTKTIDNDLKLVDTAIRNYYDIKPVAAAAKENK